MKNGNVGVNGLGVYGNTLLDWAVNGGGTITYLNFSNSGSPLTQSSGYGIRDNNGTIEFKNSGGSWASVQSIVNNLCGGTCGSGVGGSGTSGYVPRFTNSTTLGNSSLTSDGKSTTANGNFFITGALNTSGSQSNYGALTIRGTKSGWSGINFQDLSGDNYGTFMIYSNPNYSGVYNTADNNWDWYWNGSTLVDGTVPAANVGAGTFGGNFTFSNGPYTNDWFRVNGSGGIYWSNYGGGWYMSDGTWLRAYSNVSVYTGGTMRADSGFCIGGSCISSWPSDSSYVWHWNGQGGQPTWLWGSNDGTNMYVWNPSNFDVSYANSAGSVAWSNVTSKPYPVNGQTWNWNGQSGQPTWLWGSNDGNNMYVWNPSNFNVANSAELGGVPASSYARADGGQFWAGALQCPTGSVMTGLDQQTTENSIQLDTENTAYISESYTDNVLCQWIN